MKKREFLPGDPEKAYHALPMFHALVVDDFAQKREQVIEVVEQAHLGVPVVGLEHAHEALPYISEHAREIILAIFDHTFVGENRTGLDLIEALRALNSDAFIYLFTSHPQKSDEYRSRETKALARKATGVFSTNMKPYNGYDWLYMELEENRTKLLAKFGL